MPRKIARLFATLLVLAANSVVLLAQAPSAGAPLSQIAVDVVTLKTGPALRGAIVERHPAGAVTLVCSAGWLQQHAPRIHDQQLAVYRADQPRICRDVLERIAEWLPQTAPGSRLQIFLMQEQARLTEVSQRPEVPPPEFFWITLTADEISKIRVAPPDRQGIALRAWHEHLPEVESRRYTALVKELEARKISLTGPPPDLSDHLPALRQSDEEWTARQAIVEYALTQPLDLQGLGTKLIPVQPGEAVNWAQLLPDILEQELQRLTAEVLEQPPLPQADPQAWLNVAVSIAKQEQVRGFRVTRLVSHNSTEVTVASQFVARRPGDTWKIVWSDLQVARVDQRQPALEAQLADDPQIKAVLQVVTAVSPDASSQVQAALQTGAATHHALTASNAAFFRFQDRYLRHLDRPYLPIPQ